MLPRANLDRDRVTVTLGRPISRGVSLGEDQPFAVYADPHDIGGKTPGDDGDDEVEHALDSLLDPRLGAEPGQGCQTDRLVPLGGERARCPGQHLGLTLGQRETGAQSGRDQVQFVLAQPDGRRPLQGVGQGLECSPVLLADLRDRLTGGDSVEDPHRGAFPLVLDVSRIGNEAEGGSHEEVP